VTLLAAGDIASCASDGDEATAKILARTPGTIAALGDLAYDRGTAEELRDCYGPSWGRFLARTRAALGNHEYGTGNADAAIAYFGLPPNGWYSYDLGAWHIVVLNSNCSLVGGCDEGSPQVRWLEDDLAAHPARCTLAYWHHPRFSSGIHGSDSTMAPIWRVLARAGADVVLAGHDHDYERFAPFGGIRSFVVGTGGKSRYPLLFPLRRPRSIARSWSADGVLRLTLRPAGYDWRFLPAAGASFTDAGTGTCR
jgi:3',5'-cyclic AMP phosphodiesterase CpdA